MDDDTEEVSSDKTPEIQGRSKTVRGKKLRSTLLITIGMIALVVIALYGSNIYLLEQSDICSTVCHKPMDRYVADYSDQNLFLAVNRHADQSISCIECHSLSLADQLSMGFSWIRDDYSFSEKTSLLDNHDYTDEEFCFRSGCHADLDREDTITSRYGLLFTNPHRDNGYSCSDCHSTHRDIVIKRNIECSVCHASNELLTLSLNSFTAGSEFLANPHTPVDWLASDQSLIHSSDQADIMRCESCHGSHVLPYAATKDPKIPDVSYCYRACHHTYDFIPCMDCHRERDRR